ncbi:response regulator [Sphingomonas sp. CLY1604]|uniref:response regulator n=1 Tax=Sphingomonas sp. CLY1604 TaxID=3457786 RepID=UPI003FD753CB
MPLNDRRILVVEDEYMLAHDLCDALQEAGAIPIGPEPSVQAALMRIASEEQIDAAILDVNLNNETVFPVADLLTDRHVPFLFASGYGSEVFTERFAGAVNCNKPLDMRAVLRALAGLM